MNALSPQLMDSLAGSTALSPIGADAQLIAVCAAFCDLERAYDATGTGDEGAADRERARIVAEQQVLVDRMCGLPCNSLAGVQAMATALVSWDRELLRDVPAHDVGEQIASNMVERLLALSPEDQRADADLIAVCAEFRASEAAFCAIYNDETDDDDASEALSAPIAASWDAMLDRMSALHASTHEGLAARALALAQHSGIKPGSRSYDFGFEPGADTVTGRLLHYLLRDAVALGHGFPVSNPDAELLSLRPEYDRLRASYDAIDNDSSGTWSEEAASAIAEAFDAHCRLVARMPSAETRVGRAFQAIALMHQLIYVCAEQDGPGGALHTCWSKLEREVGGEFPLPGAASTSNNATSVESEMELLALRPEYLRLRAACDEENARDGEWTNEIQAAIGKPFDGIIARILELPRAVSSAGRALQAIAAMHEMYVEGMHLSEEGRGGWLCWQIMKREVAGAYRLPGARS